MRQRKITSILILIMVFLLLVLLFCNVQAVEKISYTEYTIIERDTIWSIANDLDRNENIQKTICEIRHDNNNLDPMLTIGQIIKIRNIK